MGLCRLICRGLYWAYYSFIDEFDFFFCFFVDVDVNVDSSCVSACRLTPLV